MIRFEGELQEHEFRRAQWVSTPGVFRWIGWLIAAVVVMTLATGGLQPILREPLTSTIKLAGMATFALFLIIAPRRAITKAWRNTPLLHERVTGQLSEAGVAWKTASTDSTFGWEKLTRQKIAGDLMLLYTSTNQALIIPRSYFHDAGEWEKATELIAAKVRS